MAYQSLKKLKRMDLLEMLIAQVEENERLLEKIEQLQFQLERVRTVGLGKPDRVATPIENEREQIPVEDIAPQATYKPPEHPVPLEQPARQTSRFPQNWTKRDYRAHLETGGLRPEERPSSTYSQKRGGQANPWHPGVLPSMEDRIKAEAPLERASRSRMRQPLSHQQRQISERGEAGRNPEERATRQPTEEPYWLRDPAEGSVDEAWLTESSRGKSL